MSCDLAPVVVVERTFARCQDYCEQGMYEKAWKELEALPYELRTSAEVHEWRVRVLMEMGENEMASGIGMTLCDNYPNRLDLRLLTVECLLRLNQNKEALDFLTSGAAHYVDEYAACFYLARLHNNGPNLITMQ